jgi:hypothetical protein
MEIVATINATIAILLAVWASRLACRASRTCSDWEASLTRANQASANSRPSPQVGIRLKQCAYLANPDLLKLRLPFFSGPSCAGQEDALQNEITLAKYI